MKCNNEELNIHIRDIGNFKVQFCLINLKNLSFAMDFRDYIQSKIDQNEIEFDRLEIELYENETKYIIKRGKNYKWTMNKSDLKFNKTINQLKKP